MLSRSIFLILRQNDARTLRVRTLRENVHEPTASRAPRQRSSAEQLSRVRFTVQQPQNSGDAHVIGAQVQTGTGRVGLQVLPEVVRTKTFVAPALQNRAQRHGHRLFGLRAAVRQQTRTL